MITFKQFNEGGAFGHLSNVYDVNLTFSQMNQFISDALSGKLEYVEEKTDAVNLMVSYRKDKGIIAARNKSHLKNFGENALSPADIRIKFKGRELEHAYGKAMDDFQDAIHSLSDKQSEKIFANGSKWMSIEVMGNGAENIIEYGVRELRLHGTIEHNEAGEQIGPIDKEAARVFDGMLRQRGTHQQSEFTIKKLNRVKLPKVEDFKSLESKYKKELSSIMKNYSLKGSDNIETLKIKAWEKELKKANITNKELHDLLINRWAKYNKQPSISNIKKSFPEYSKFIDSTEKNMPSINKQIMLPIEKLFLSLGADRLKTMSEFMSINPDKTVDSLRNKIETAIDKIKTSGNVELLNKLEIEMDRLNASGKLLPTEGITFFWNGHFLKLTGSFAPANQIIGMLYRL